MLKELIKNTPVLGKFAIMLYSRLKGIPYFTSSGNYWEERYKRGGNSGAGSYNRFAEFKAEVINPFVKENNISSVIEFGCGDGNQLKYFQFKMYTGFDVSKTAINTCIELFRNDPTKHFRHVDSYHNDKADLTLSLDVIYHLIEDNVFEQYMNQLFQASNKYVIIYASNKNENPVEAVHVKHRKFTEWVNNHITSFKLIKHIPNKYPWNGNEYETSFADFFIYEKTS